MSDDKTKRGQQDAMRISKNDPSEVAYAAKVCGVSSQDVIDAIEAIGSNMREEVYAYLKGKK